MTNKINYNLRLNHWVAIFSLLCLLFNSLFPHKLSAQYCPQAPCILIKEEDKERRKTAKIVAGATLIALVGGVAYFALASSSCHGHHSSSSSNYYYDHDSHFFDSYYSQNFRPFIRQKTLDFVPSKGKHRFNRKDSLKDLNESNEISGTFIAQSVMSSSDHGSMTAFIRLPDGSTQTLGTIDLSSRGSSIPYGPFTQKGTYAFNIKLEDAIPFTSNVKVGTIEIEVNGAKIENHDFFVPPYPPSNYEPAAFEYTLQ